MKTTEVFVVVPDPSERNELLDVLEMGGFFVKSFGSAETMLIHLMRYPTNVENARCILIDEQQPGISGLQTLAQIKKLEPSLKVVMISHETTAANVIQAWENGASRFLLHPFAPDDLVSALRGCLDQKLEQGQSDDELVEQVRADHKKLTPREREVLLLVAKGRRNQEIGTDLGISLATVKMHRANLMRKLEIDSVAQLVSFHHQCLRFL